MSLFFVTAAVSFAATNIDDLFLLAIFFSQSSHRWRIVAGQYLGFSALVFISLTGFIGGRILDPKWIALLGIVPIFIGLKKLFARNDQQQTPTTSGVIEVALITFANGGDNIGIYAPLFATANSSQLAIFLAVFYLMLGLLCWCGYLIARQPFVALVLRRYGRWIVPFVLMALGIYILIGNRI